MLTLLMLMAIAPGDTTVAVTKGARLDVSLFNGSVTVRAWTQNAVRVTGGGSQAPRVIVSGSVVTVGSSSRFGFGADDLVVSAPAWMPVSVHGVGLNIAVDGMKGGANLRTVQGEVKVENAEGEMELGSVAGAITVANVTGRVVASSVSNGVTLTNVAGPIKVSSTSGWVRLMTIQSTSVDASVISGEIRFDGVLRPDGRYSLSAHSGNVWMAIPEGSSANMSINTFSGHLESDFPLSLEPNQRGTRRMTFVLGGGSARVELGSFSGNVRLVRRSREADPTEQ